MARGVGWLVAVLAAGVGVLALEGAASLVLGEGVSQRIARRGELAVSTPAAFDRDAFAGLTEGPYARDRDPEVGFRMKSGAVATFAGVEARTDAFGQRVRVGPAPEPDATRIVVLGDSVAFGFGVADDETLAHALEQALAETMEPGTPRPVVLTVACPGWNQTSSFRYLRDHLARLDPDVVLYVAIENDLDDSTAIDELGLRTADVDPSPLRPQASIERHIRLLRTMEHRPSRAALMEVVLAGGPRVVKMALYTRQTRESRGRWASFVAAIGALDRDLAARGVCFAVVLPFDRDFYRRAEALLARERPPPSVIGLISERYDQDTLGHDPHPNARCLRACARRAAEELIARELVPGAGASPLAPADERYAQRPYLALEDAEALLAEQDALYARFVRHEIDLETALGIHQVYGGLLGDGTVGKHVHGALCLEGAGAIELVIARRSPESAVWPLELAIEVDGEPLARLHVPRPTAGEAPRWRAVVPLPEEAAGACRDVLVRASTWELEHGPHGAHLASFRLRRLALLR